MPKFNFICESCGSTKERLVSSSVTEADCGCGGKLKRQIPSTVSSMTHELKDKYRGVHQQKGLEGKLKERMNKHHDSTSEILEKIDKYGLDDAIKFGWLKKVKNRV